MFCLAAAQQLFAHCLLINSLTIPECNILSLFRGREYISYFKIPFTVVTASLQI